MSKAIGMVEYKTVSTGMTAADNMVKTSNVEILQASTVCPGKYIVIITGELSAVRSSVDAAMKNYPKGSSEAKRAYEEIVQTAQATEDLDYRKEINDIADKALGYTKGELTNAQNGN